MILLKTEYGAIWNNPILKIFRNLETDVVRYSEKIFEMWKGNAYCKALTVDSSFNEIESPQLQLAKELN